MPDDGGVKRENPTAKAREEDDVDALLNLCRGLVPIKKLSARDHATLQRARRRAMERSLERAVAIMKEHRIADRLQLSPKFLLFDMRSEMESAINSLIVHNTDLRRGEKRVSLRHTARRARTPRRIFDKKADTEPRSSRRARRI
jgi:hypothetical protein